MKTQKLVAVLVIALFTFSAMNAQEKDISKVKKEVVKVAHTDAYACPMKCEGEKKYEKEGNCPKCKMDLKKMNMKKVYTCSMHPEIVSDKKGECPKCGMALTEKKMEMKKMEMKMKKDASHEGHNHE